MRYFEEREISEEREREKEKEKSWFSETAERFSSDAAVGKSEDLVVRVREQEIGVDPDLQVLGKGRKSRSRFLSLIRIGKDKIDVLFRCIWPVVMAGEASSTPWGKVSSKPQDQNKGFFNIDNEEGSPAKSRSFKDVLAGSSSDILPSLSPSTFNGVPAVLISDDDVLKLASPFRFTLVGKFGVRRQNLDAIRSFFGSIFGRPLQTDQATASRTRPSVARVLVEVDITKKHAKEPINVDNSDCNEEEPTEDQEEGEYLPEQTLSDSMEKENLYKNGDGRSSDTHSDKVINVQISHNQFNFYASVVYAASTRTGCIPLWDCLTDFSHTINGPCNFTAPAAFRFQNMWIKHTDFLNAVSENWNALVFPDNNIQGMNRLWSKLSRLKQMLRWWNKHVFKNLFDNIKEAEEKVLIADNLYLDNTSAENLANLDHCKLSLFNLQNQEEIFWKQKASNAILVEGDRNTSFFHALVNKNRIKSYIHKIVDEHGVVYDTGDNIAKSGVDFFFNNFNSCKSVVSIVNTSVIPNIVDDTDNNFLTQLPLEEEIWDTIKGMNVESVAGPDGFTTKFFVKTWEIIRVDVVDAVHDFFKDVLRDICQLTVDYGKKLNTDGSVGVHSAGFGGIIRNYLGNPLNAFAGPLDVCPVLSAELRSLSFGLERCIILGYHHVNIEVDSKTIIHFISENSIGNPQDLYIIRKIKLMLGEMDYTISHIFREVNVIVINLWNPEFILSKLVFEDFEGAGDAGVLFSFFIHCDKLGVVIWIWLLVCDLLSFAISIKCSGMEANFTFVYISFPGQVCLYCGETVLNGNHLIFQFWVHHGIRAKVTSQPPGSKAHCPTMADFTPLKCLLRYVQGIATFGLPLQPSSLQLTTYSDADWAGDTHYRKSLTGFCTYLGKSLISWCVKKQVTVAKLSIEAEYRALSSATSDVIWLRQLLADFHVVLDKPTPIFYDNTSAMALAHNPVFHARTKHIEIDYHFIWHHIEAGAILIHYINSEDQPAGILTKPLSSSRFIHLRHS
ncbi:hypothetical protein KFK09_024340 [Dendrobium nobile]|uniref:RNase H type-1 domain-containing protein n=1 Tax=Dendrobium nobile TaxID=94219 RepID=A0A8T3ADI4_DENNO|nr:hypothetical protein KFK09_024340 [Dendrobium nobile]